MSLRRSLPRGDTGGERVVTPSFPTPRPSLVPHAGEARMEWVAAGPVPFPASASSISWGAHGGKRRLARHRASCGGGCAKVGQLGGMGGCIGACSRVKVGVAPGLDTMMVVMTGLAMGQSVLRLAVRRGGARWVRWHVRAVEVAVPMLVWMGRVRALLSCVGFSVRGECGAQLWCDVRWCWLGSMVAV